MPLLCLQFWGPLTLSRFPWRRWTWPKELWRQDLRRGSNKHAPQYHLKNDKGLKAQFYGTKCLCKCAFLLALNFRPLFQERSQRLGNVAIHCVLFTWNMFIVCEVDIKLVLWQRCAIVFLFSLKKTSHCESGQRCFSHTTHCSILYNATIESSSTSYQNWSVAIGYASSSSPSQCEQSSCRDLARMSSNSSRDLNGWQLFPGRGILLWCSLVDFELAGFPLLDRSSFRSIIKFVWASSLSFFGTIEVSWSCACWAYLKRCRRCIALHAGLYC